MEAAAAVNAITAPVRYQRVGIALHDAWMKYKNEKNPEVDGKRNPHIHLSLVDFAAGFNAARKIVEDNLQ